MSGAGPAVDAIESGQVPTYPTHPTCQLFFKAFSRLDRLPILGCLRCLSMSSIDLRRFYIAATAPTSNVYRWSMLQAYYDQWFSLSVPFEVYACHVWKRRLVLVY